MTDLSTLVGGGVTGYNWVAKTTTYTAINNDGILADSSVGAFTINLPATPVMGHKVMFSDGKAAGSWGTNVVTVGRNGATIEGASADFSLNVAGGWAEFVYDGTTWQVRTQFVSSGGGGIASPAYKNLLINGNFDVWQRGTSIAIAAAIFSADRWQTNDGGSATVTRQTTGVPRGSQYCLRSTQGALSYNNISQTIETNEVLKVIGKIVTVSIKARRNATFAGSLILILDKSATVNAARTDTWTAVASVVMTNANLPTGTTYADWYTASFTTTIPADGTANTLRVLIGHGAAEASGAYYEISQVQLEVAATATDFEYLPFSVQKERCKPYYYKSYDYGVVPGTATTAGIQGGSGNAAAPTTGYLSFTPTFPEMRAIPNIVTYDSLGAAGKLDRSTLGAAATPGVASGHTYKGTKSVLIYSTSGVSHTYIECYFTADAEL